MVILFLGFFDRSNAVSLLVVYFQIERRRKGSAVPDDDDIRFCHFEFSLLIRETGLNVVC
jgi:hypothetical protein